VPTVTPRSRIWTYVLVTVAAFMVNLDTPVVITGLPSISRDLHTTVQGLQWVINAYTLTFAVLILTGAALGDRFGRRRNARWTCSRGRRTRLDGGGDGPELLLPRAPRSVPGDGDRVPLIFTAVAPMVLGAVRPEQHGIASGANNALRELGGVFGIAVLGAIFAANGSPATAHAFVAGTQSAIAAGAVVVATTTVAVCAIGRRKIGRRQAIRNLRAPLEPAPAPVA